MSRILLTVALASLLPLAACADDPASGGGEPVSSQALADRAFVSTDVTGHDLVAGSMIRIAFEPGRLSANAGCNTLGAAYTIEDGTLTLDGTPAATMMACDEDLMDQDTWLAGFLAARPRAGLDGDDLTLAADGVTLTMLDETIANPAAPLTSTVWTLDSIIDADAVSSVPAGVDPPTLTISSSGEATVSTGCNQGGASVETTDATATFGPMRLTKMACDPDASGVEQAVIGVLNGEVDYTIEGSVLTIMNGDQGLSYRAS